MSRLLIGLLLVITVYPPAVRATPCDSLYAANHPRLMFRPADLPGLQAKVADGGYDQTAYEWIRWLTDDLYPTFSMSTLLRTDFGRSSVMNLGVAAWLASPFDTASADLGRTVTMYLVDNYDVDADEADSSFRLGSLAFGYDMFFDACDDSLRAVVRNEMTTYMQTMVNQVGYQLFAYRPYLANHSAMVAGALGLAAVCLADEADPFLVQSSIDFADAIVESLLTYQIDPDGSYKEGVNYAGWMMRHLVYYFEARKAWDGFDYSTHPRIRKMEEWLAYELLPEGYGYTNNINDSMYNNFPLAMHTTYIDWAQSAWGSALAAYIFDHTAGVYGINTGVEADKPSTVLWNQQLAPVQPEDVLPHAKLWLDRGLYYYRTGWPVANSSDDVVFSFFSGKFHGGHAQEDQNQFTLYGYGGRLVIDHGAGGPASESEAHNVILIDGAGQYGTGGSIGTDGVIRAHVLNDFADFVQGDATQAYGTHSPFNNPDYPIEGIDWSFGYEAGNPVNEAIRSVVVMHEGEAPPYFVIVDDIEKDGAAHTYKWRLHTDATNTIETASDPVRIVAPSSHLDIHALGQPFDDLVLSVSSFNNGTFEPDADVLVAAINAVRPNFAFLLIPGANGGAAPAVKQRYETWGSLSELDWGGGVVDYVLRNASGGKVTASLDDLDPGGSRREFHEDVGRTQVAGPRRLTTDAEIAIVRLLDGEPAKYVATNATSLSFGNRPLVIATGDPIHVAAGGATIDVDHDGDFTLYAPAASEVRVAGTPAGFTTANGYVTLNAPVANTPAPTTSAPVPPRLRVYPNPFTPALEIDVDVEETSHIRIIVYDVMGRRVATIWNDTLPRGRHTFVWQGAGDDGTPAASGVYFVRVTSPGGSRTHKITRIR